ncbi:MAG TPA: hypothetical protein VN673_07300, partial [Clostridia bacterium]|nr:hypothetical protein [Clostridia bacterium]
PNSWRTGLQLFSGYLRSNANTAICVAAFGLSATAEYGLSVQVMGIAMGMATVWTMVKWPVVGQYRSAGNLLGLQRVLWSRSWLQVITFLVLAAGAILVGPMALSLFSKDNQMLPGSLLWLLALVTLLDMTFAFWGTLLSVENRIPTLWATVATNVASLVLALVFTYYTDVGVAGLILAPLITGLVFNYWYWPVVGAKSMGTSWWQFTFGKPQPTPKL